MDRKAGFFSFKIHEVDIIDPMTQIVEINLVVCFKNYSERKKSKNILTSKTFLLKVRKITIVLCPYLLLLKLLKLQCSRGSKSPHPTAVTRDKKSNQAFYYYRSHQHPLVYLSLLPILLLLLLLLLH